MIIIVIIIFLSFVAILLEALGYLINLLNQYQVRADERENWIAVERKGGGDSRIVNSIHLVL